MPSSRLLISSFGLGSNLRHKAFYQLPPIRLDITGTLFVPEYPALFLYDEILIDGATCERVLSKSLSPRLIPVRHMVQALKDIGRLRTIDYQAEIAGRTTDIGRDVEKTLRRVRELTVPTLDLDKRWRDWVENTNGGDPGASPIANDKFERTLQQELLRAIHPRSGRRASEIISSLSRTTARDEREFALDYLRQFLWHVRSHIYLADLYESTTYEWDNVRPFYIALKRTELGPVTGMNAKAQELFSVLWPDWRPDSARALARALADKRIEKLRSRIRAAYLRQEKFDEAFAAEVFRQVYTTGTVVQRWQRLLGWATEGISKVVEGVVGTPGLGNFLGAVLDKPLEHFASHALQKREEQRSLPWFFVVGSNFSPPQRTPKK